MCDDERKLRSNIANKPMNKDMSVSDLANLVKNQFASYQRSTSEDIKIMGEKLSTEMEKFNRELTLDIEQLRKDNKRTYAELTTSIKIIESNTSHALEVATRINDLIISGVPFVQGEDLSSYFKIWCRSLGYAQECYPLADIRRLVGRNSNPGNVSIVLLQFAITVQRNDFYSRYLRTRSLALTDLGFAVNKRIYVNESLGPITRKLRSKALQCKKDGILQAVFTRNGTIYVKRTAEDREIAVRSAVDLESLLNSD